MILAHTCSVCTLASPRLKPIQVAAASSSPPLLSVGTSVRCCPSSERARCHGNVAAFFIYVMLILY